MVQRKRKRMSATMYREGLKEYYCMSKKESRCQVMTRIVVHKKNATTMMKDHDQEWIEDFNKRIIEREGKSQLSEDTFEKLMEYFEKESARVSAENHVVLPLRDPLKDSKENRSSDFDMKIGKADTSNTRKEKQGLVWGKNSSMLSSVPQSLDCCICNGGENSVSNPVYRCESCAIYVHQSCYGIDERLDAGPSDSLQTSRWLCRKCEAFGKANEHIW